MSSRLFTLLADYDGGTFISQCEADSPKQALVWWSKEEFGRLNELRPDKKMIERVRRNFSGQNAMPSALAGLQSAWCAGTMSIRGRVLLLNIVETKKEANQPLQRNASTGSASDFGSPARRG